MIGNADETRCKRGGGDFARQRLQNLEFRGNIAGALPHQTLFPRQFKATR